MSKNLIHEYVNSVAGEVVSPETASEFIQGLEEFYRDSVVSYDIKEDGLLKSKTNSFPTFMEAYDFAKQLKSLGKPIIEESNE